MENIQPEEKLETHRINKPNYAAAWKETVKEEEPPMPLEQWNKMIEEAEKEVAKEDPKKKDFKLHNESRDRRQASENKGQSGRIKPNLTQVVYPESYVQNEEQSSKSHWKKLYE